MITFHVEEGENNLPLEVHYRNKVQIESITKTAIKLIIPSLVDFWIKTSTESPLLSILELRAKLLSPYW